MIIPKLLGSIQKIQAASLEDFLCSADFESLRDGRKTGSSKMLFAVTPPSCENAFGAALRLRSNESPGGAFKQASGLR